MASLPFRFQDRTQLIPLAELDSNFDYLNEKVVFAEDFGTLAGDGATDDWATIQKALNDAPNGSIVCLKPTSLGYRVSATLVVPPDKTLMGMTNASNEVITSATIVGDLAVTPVIRVDAITSVNGAITNIGVSRAAGVVPAGSIGILFQGNVYTKLTNIRVYRHAVGIKFDGTLGITVERLLSSQITTSHLWFDDAIQTRFSMCIFGQVGASDVNCDEYIRISGLSDGMTFLNCQFNQGNNGVLSLVERAIRWENYTGANGLLSFDACHFEYCNYMFSQVGTVYFPRIGFSLCSLNPDVGWEDGTIPSGFFVEFTLVGSPFILYDVDLVGMVRSNICNNTFLNNLTIDGGSGTVVGNTIIGNLTVTGVCAGLVVAGNALTGAGSTITNTSSGQRSIYGNSVANATLNKTSMSRFEYLRSRTVASDRLAAAYSPSITLDASDATRFIITPNNGAAFTINAPTSPGVEQEIEILIVNSTGGALGAVTWNAIFKMAAWVNPANGFHRSIRFWYNGVSWFEQQRTTSDIPN